MLVEERLAHAARPPSGDLPAVRDARLADDLVVEVEHERAVLDEQRRGSAWTFREYIWLACRGIVAGRLRSPTIVTPPTHDRLAGHRQLAVPARLGGEVDDHRARAHAVRPRPR